MVSFDTQKLSADEVEYLVHHVVLPPKLPQTDDYNSSHERCFLDSMLCALRGLEDSSKDCEARAIISTGIACMENLRNNRDDDGNVTEHHLREVFRHLTFATTDETVPLEVKAQNAGLLIGRHGQDIIFEAFELSPVNNAVMSSVGRLVRTFPGTASKLSKDLMQDETFRHSLAYTIAKMTTQMAPGTQPRVRKNGTMIDENRDTTHPEIVSDWLMQYISALGESTSTLRISKNTREETLWSDCKHPWRRSPLWLLVRVTLQLLFTRLQAATQHIQGLYKATMVQLLSQVLVSVSRLPVQFICDTDYRRLEKFGSLIV